MNRRSDIGWPELIVGIILIILGVVIMRQPVGVLTWIVILCGVLAICSGVGDIVLYVKMERFTGFGPVVSLVTGILGVMAGFMLNSEDYCSGCGWIELSRMCEINVKCRKSERGWVVGVVLRQGLPVYYRYTDRVSPISR